MSIDSTSADPDGADMQPMGSIGNALRVLTLLRNEGAVRGATAARELAIAGSTAHRLLAMLQHYGFVVQNRRTKEYTAGPALVEIGLEVASKPDLRGVAHPHLEAVRNSTGETCGLSVLQGTESVLLDVLDGTQQLRVVEHIGRRDPAHTTSAGKAILAQLSREEIRRLFPDETLPSPTEHAVASRRELELALERIRARGFATNMGESGAGTAGIGAAVLHRNGSVVAGISIALPYSRLDSGTEKALGETVRAAADAIGRALP